MALLQKIILISGLIASLLNLKANLLLLIQAIVIGLILIIACLISLNRFIRDRRLQNDKQLTGDKL